MTASTAPAPGEGGAKRQKHLLPTDTCETCRFCRVSERQYAGLECRRMPPIMVEHKSSCATWSAPGWPDVWEDQGCGEYVFGGARVEDTSFSGQQRRKRRAAIAKALSPDLSGGEG